MIKQFSPPTAQEKAQALGCLAGSPISLRKSLSNFESFFESMPLPGPEDWLSCNYEHGQTFDQFKVYANVPTSEKNKFYIQPYDSNLSRELISILQSFSTVFFPGVKFIVRKPIEIEALDISRRENSGVFQFNASQVLNKMYKVAPLDRFAMIGVTLEDIYHADEWNFVFGLANVVNKTGIFSFARYGQEFYGLPPDNDLTIFRAVKVMVHEMCHMFGLLHCVYYKCIMNGSNHIGETDSKPLILCPVCLRKLWLCLGFDCVQRYLRLAEKCQEIGGYFQRFEVWYRERAQGIQKDLPKVKGGFGKNNRD